LASKPQRWIVAQRIRIVMVAPPLRDEQQAGADQRGEIMRESTWLRGSCRRAVIQATMPLRSSISRSSTAPGRQSAGRHGFRREVTG
jgi:hypothetical protein